MAYVFAYGSNMLNERMRSRDRIPNARPLGVAKLTGYKFVCDKRSQKDGSGKGNIHKSESGLVWGVVFEMPDESLAELDKIENGYERFTVQVELDGRITSVETYMSTDLTEAPPTAEYKGYIIAGARQHGLLDDYIAMLEGIPTSD